MDAGNMLKPALARGELHVIGATTLEEYRRTSRRTRRWPAASSRSWCPSPPPRTPIEILRGLRDRYEAHHQVRYTDEALVAAVELVRPLSHRPLPARTRRST